MEKENPFGLFHIPIIIDQENCYYISKEVMKNIIDMQIEEAKRKIYHTLGLDDGTYELSQELK